jgi:hypothetical protein
MKNLNIFWIIGAAINMTLFYINVYEGDYLYATLTLLCALVFALNIK